MKNRADGRPHRAARAALIIIVIIILLAAAVAAAYFIMRRGGREELRAEGAIALPSPSAAAGEPEPPAVPEGADAVRNGVAYRYRDELVTILLMGIDSDADKAQTDHYFDGDHTDAIYLAVLDGDGGEVNIIAISRNTMTQMEMYGAYGDYLGKKTAQLGMAFAYGDTPERGCELARDAVSNLFYGLPISGYYAVYMDAVSAANDALGGVPIELPSDMTHIDPTFTVGAEVTLTGSQALRLLRSRDTDATGSNELRMNNQAAYIKAFAARARQLFKSNPLLPVDIYRTIAEYSVTDISMSSAVYLAGAALNAQPGEIRTVPGEVIAGEKFDEFYADDEKLYDLILDVFYEEIA